MLPETILPMEPVQIGEPFDDPKFLYQVKWDGIRMISYIEGGRVRLHSRSLRSRDGFYPELDLLVDLTPDGTVLDGELVALKDGKPSFPLVLRREQVTTLKQARELAGEVPVAYLVFDMLYCQGRPLLKEPLSERQRYLKEFLQEAGSVHIVESFASGIDLFQVVKEQELEGIVAKRRSSPYLIGRKSSEWRKVKVRRRQLCLVGGYTTEGKRVRSLLVGAWQNGNLRYLGRVGTGLTAQEWDVLAEQLPALSVETCPFVQCPRAPGLHFVSPVLPVWVEYSEWTPDLLLRAPSIIGFATAKPTECYL
ncbi:MAG: non-homologous end-joining DNA ligase [bacterium]|jgi:bifunctional non-homologous end joining protein LigD